MKRITDEHRRKLKGVLGAFGLAAFAWLFVSDYLQQHNTVANTHQIQINTADITKIEKDRLKDLNTIKAYALQIDKIGAQIESDLESGQTTSAKVVIALCETMPACAVQLPNIMQSVVRH